MRIRDRLQVGLILGGLLACSGPAAAQPQLTPRQKQLVESIKWQNGPCEAKLGTVATIKVPAGYQFTNGAGARAIQELGAEPPDPKTLGLITATADDVKWSLFFRFDDIGYVKDDEKDKIDADAILAGIKAGTEEANKYRVQNGGTPLQVVGWEQKPSYNTQTNRLVWAIRGHDRDGDIINYNSRILGRGGVMSANLIIQPNELQTTLPTYTSLLGGFAYVPGQSHSEWRLGDKVAEHGLTALIAGGTVAVAAKTGLLGKLIKPLILAGVAVLAVIGKMYRWLTGRKQSPEQSPDQPV